MMKTNKVHRVPVMQQVPEKSILCMLTHQRILNFLLLKFKSTENLGLLHQITIKELKCGVMDLSLLKTISYETSLIKALEILSNSQISGIPIVDENNVLLDVYSRSDVLYLALDKTYNNLDMSVKQALTNHIKFRNVPFCFPQDTLFSVISQLVKNRKLRMTVVEPETKKLIGNVSLTDIFNFILEDLDKIPEESKQAPEEESKS